ncbi:hypothetical protein [Chlorobium phaeobacteroides]|jgi:hypothetical protein|uniref:Uncharacterized protein n=1 Tax=Chlorobium phaeobacteroides (strain DSM 266 / SMG 266 / 2430) TaxID=290317 RepID=A1BH22_CHLPD|nr:hypothetical protein [Chlorobium phaeobacteroides]ABL65699.1 conserved hypothetical protein [Chlorobium phaeobacteroides DSM 266]MBV5330219.1 hypothetical protein [Chlorobium sp.]
MKKTRQLTLLEETVKTLGYTLRYEKGTFLGGDCRLKEDNMVVVNKFLPIEGKIYTLAKVIGTLNPAGLSPDIRKIIGSVVQRGLFNKEIRE